MSPCGIGLVLRNVSRTGGPVAHSFLVVAAIIVEIMERLTTQMSQLEQQKQSQTSAEISGYTIHHAESRELVRIGFPVPEFFFFFSLS